MTLRLRLALLASLLSSAVVVVLFFALYAGVRGTLEGVLEDSLRAGVQSRMGRTEPFDRRGGDGPRPSRPTPPGLATVVTYSPAGALESGTPPVTVPLAEGMTSREGFRVLTARQPSGGWVQAFRAEDELLSSLERVTRLFFFLAPGTVLLGFLGGYLLAGRALRPVDAVTRLASRIAQSGRYAERVPEARGQDEMARLTQTINAMLDRLSLLIERERAFALAAAHELRTPLAVIRARASLALERERDPASYRRALEEVRGVSTDMVALTERLLALARAGGPAHPEPLDLADLALEASELHSAVLEDKRLHLDLELDSARVQGDRTALLLAASNLVQNAARYTPPGGRVRVSTLQRGGQAILRVEDSGPGIPEAEVSRLLQPFQRGARLQGSEGAGLGLALIGAVTEQHGGEFALERSEWGGLRAEVRLGGPARSRAEGPNSSEIHDVEREPASGNIAGEEWA